MAKKESVVFLGFEDEEIGAESNEINSKVNKIGGLPNWPNTESTIEISPCFICGMKRPLILQMYAPLEHSLYHRTFFIFSCLRPSCSQNDKSWTCIRIQNLETKVTCGQIVGGQTTKMKQKQKNGGAKIIWCNDFDDWGQESCDDKISTMFVEENGNANTTVAYRMDESDEEDDDDGNVTLVSGLSQLNIKQQKEKLKAEPNANCAAGLTLVKESEEHTFAEIESEETDLVLAEAPIKPKTNLKALLSTSTHANFTDVKDLTLKSFYIAVDLEQPLEEYENLSVEHIQEIYEKYKLEDEDGECFGAAGGAGVNCETYETTIPLHGDAMFHNFLSTIKANPTQILRYTRDAAPILIEPLVDFDLKCKHCNGPTIGEVQILPTLIPKLRFQATGQAAPIDFGNVLIFTCLRSCWDTNDKMRDEYVIVQKEK